MLVTVSIEARTSAHVDGYPAEQIAAVKKMSLTLDGPIDDVVRATDEFVGPRLSANVFAAVSAAEDACGRATARLAKAKAAQPEFAALGAAVTVTASSGDACSPPKVPPPADQAANQPKTPHPGATAAATMPVNPATVKPEGKK